MNVRRRVITVLVALIASAISARADPLPRSVLILDQSGPGVPGYMAISAAFRTALRSNSDAQISVYAENLDLTHFIGPAYEHLLQDHLRRKYEEKPIGILLAVGSAALEFALRLRTDRWSDAPIVFAAVDEATAARLSHAPNLTGTTIRLTLANAVLAARALVPELKRVALVGDPLERQTFRRHFTQELPALSAELDFIDLLGLPFEDVKARVANLPLDSAIVYTAITTDGTGAIYTPDDALAIIAKAANRPIVIDAENRIEYGGTGGFVILPDPIGRTAARQTLRILNGERASDIPITAGDFTKPVFAWPELQRWHVAEESLPSGSEIRFRPPGMWEQYRARIVAALGLLLVQSGVIAALLFERRRRRIAEAESRERLAAVTHLDRVASASTLTSSIAHELNQPLGAILSNAEAAEMVLATKAPDLAMCREILADIRRDDRRAAEIIRHIRGFMKSAPLEPQVVDLNEAVRIVLEIIATEAKEKGIRLDTEIADRLPPVRADPVHLQQVIFNLAQNAIDAMARCEAERCQLSFQTALVGGSEAQVSIADTGPGIPSEDLSRVFEKFFTTKSHGMGLGLSIARTIAEIYGGRIWAENRPGGGAVVRFTLPAQPGRTQLERT